jgi:hypothetical protein
MKELIKKYEYEYELLRERIRVCTLKEERKELELCTRALCLKDVISDLYKLLDN